MSFPIERHDRLIRGIATGGQVPKDNRRSNKSSRRTPYVFDPLSSPFDDRFHGPPRFCRFLPAPADTEPAHPAFPGVSWPAQYHNPRIAPRFSGDRESAAQSDNTCRATFSQLYEGLVFPANCGDEFPMFLELHQGPRQIFSRTRLVQPVSDDLDTKAFIEALNPVLFGEIRQ